MKNNIEFFEKVSDAMKYIIETKLGSSLSQYEQILKDKGVIKIKDKTIFVDELGLLN